MFQELNPIEPRQTWMLRALTCLISVNPRELSTYLGMECNFFTCFLELVLPPLGEEDGGWRVEDGEWRVEGVGSG